MLTIAEVKELIEALEKSSLASLKYKTAEVSLELKKPGCDMVSAYPTALPGVLHVAGEQVATSGTGDTEDAASEPDNSEKVIEITAPSVGTFYRAANPGSPAFVEIGSKVKENTVVCILEAMKLFSEIEAEVEGEVVEVLVEDGSFVEYGQALFKIKCS